MHVSLYQQALLVIMLGCAAVTTRKHCRDTSHVCAKLGHSRPASRCYRRHVSSECCATCRKLRDATWPGCEYGDTQEWCTAIGDRYALSSCYESEDICCRTCPKLRLNISGCPYGDRVLWCRHYSRQQCHGHSNFSCCHTCHTLHHNHQTEIADTSTVTPLWSTLNSSQATQSTYFPSVSPALHTPTPVPQPTNDTSTHSSPNTHTPHSPTPNTALSHVGNIINHNGTYVNISRTADAIHSVIDDENMTSSIKPINITDALSVEGEYELRSSTGSTGVRTKTSDTLDNSDIVDAKRTDLTEPKYVDVASRSRDNSGKLDVGYSSIGEEEGDNTVAVEDGHIEIDLILPLNTSRVGTDIIINGDDDDDNSPLVGTTDDEDFLSETYDGSGDEYYAYYYEEDVHYAQPPHHKHKNIKHAKNKDNAWNLQPDYSYYDNLHSGCVEPSVTSWTYCVILVSFFSLQIHR